MKLNSQARLSANDEWLSCGDVTLHEAARRVVAKSGTPTPVCVDVREASVPDVVYQVMVHCEVNWRVSWLSSI